MKIALAAALATIAAGAACAASPAPAPSMATASLPAAAVASSSASAPAPAPASAPTPAPAPAPAPASAPSSEPSAPTSACNEQSPQDFLVRSHFLKERTGNERAIQYRTEQYGYFKGFGHPPPDAQPPSAQTVTTKFMGLPIRMHRKVVPALACVEAEIKQACVDHPYTPQALAGIRFRNTYRGGEVTNHAYGIAIDIDPSINTCCGCVPPWNDAPACKRAGKSEYDHMAMPECWVHAFERFGFYWLGHDVLKDTMHFEFLGDPDKIVRAPPAR
jgi:hypothetical protein